MDVKPPSGQGPLALSEHDKGTIPDVIRWKNEGGRTAGLWMSRRHGLRPFFDPGGRTAMNSIIYLVGLIVIVLAILSFLGLR